MIRIMSFISLFQIKMNNTFKELLIHEFIHFKYKYEHRNHQGIKFCLLDGNFATLITIKLLPR